MAGDHDGDDDNHPKGSTAAGRRHSESRSMRVGIVGAGRIGGTCANQRRLP